jgi:hypothetical protein
MRGAKRTGTAKDRRGATYEHLARIAYLLGIAKHERNARKMWYRIVSDLMLSEAHADQIIGGLKAAGKPPQGSIPMRPRLRRRFDSTKSTELNICALLTSLPTPAWEKAQVWARRSSKAERRRKEFLLSSSVPESPVSVLWYSLITSWRDPGASFARSGGG